MPRTRPQAVSRAGRPDASELLGGRYRMAELVGRGATGSVWLARDEVLARDVAVKQLPDRLPRGMAEARIAARVRHPHVAAVHDLVDHGGSCWLVMDYHGGGTLASLLRDRRRLPSPVVAALGLQLLAALRAVHDAGVVHCDVKPSNLLLDEDGRLVLVDFGIAEAIGGDPTHPARQNGDVVGSPAYMAPELVRGEAPGPPADLWSFGATLYAAVEGRPPFPRGDAALTLAAVLHEPPPPARLAGRLSPVIGGLLAKEPADRPSYEEIRAALAAACSVSPPLLAATTPSADPEAAGPASAGTEKRVDDPLGPAA